MQRDSDSGQPMQPSTIAIFGAGAWGTALAIALADRHDVLLWGRDADAMRAADDARENRAYLPGFALPASLNVTSDFERTVAHVAGRPQALTIVASAVAGLRPLVQRLQPHG